MNSFGYARSALRWYLASVLVGWLLKVIPSNASPATLENFLMFITSMRSDACALDDEFKIYRASIKT